MSTITHEGPFEVYLYQAELVGWIAEVPYYYDHDDCCATTRVGLAVRGGNYKERAITLLLYADCEPLADSFGAELIYPLVKEAIYQNFGIYFFTGDPENDDERWSMEMSYQEEIEIGSYILTHAEELGLRIIEGQPEECNGRSGPRKISYKPRK